MTIFLQKFHCFVVFKSLFFCWKLVHGSSWSQLDCSLQHSDGWGQISGCKVSLRLSRIWWEVCVMDVIYFHDVGCFRIMVDLNKIESKGGKESRGGGPKTVLKPTFKPKGWLEDVYCLRCLPFINTHWKQECSRIVLRVNSLLLLWKNERSPFWSEDVVGED